MKTILITAAAAVVGLVGSISPAAAQATIAAPSGCWAAQVGKIGFSETGNNSSLTGAKVQIWWKLPAGSGASNHVVEGKSGVGWRKIATRDNSVTTFQISDGDHEQFRIKGANNDGTRFSSAVDCVWSSPVPVAPQTCTITNLGPLEAGGGHTYQVHVDLGSGNVDGTATATEWLTGYRPAKPGGYTWDPNRPLTWTGRLYSPGKLHQISAPGGGNDYFVQPIDRNGTPHGGDDTYGPFVKCGWRPLGTLYRSPEPASDCVVTGSVASGFTVRWERGTGAAKYVIRRTKNGSKPWWRGAPLEPATVFHDPAGAKAGDTLIYQIVTKDNGGKQIGNTTACTGPDTGPGPAPATPSAPAVVDNNDGTVTVTMPRADDATSYNLYRGWRADDISANVPIFTGLDPWQQVIDDGDADLDAAGPGFANGSQQGWRIQAVDDATNQKSQISKRTYFTINVANNACDDNGERLRTCQHPSTGRWELYNNDTKQFTRWQAVNVRTDKLGSHALEARDISPVSELGMNAIRLNLSWRQLEPENNNYNINLRDKVCAIIGQAHDSGTQVILDAIHGVGSTHNELPDFAWRAAYPNEPAKRSAEHHDFAVYQTDHALNYLDWIMAGSECHYKKVRYSLGTHPAVVAIEVVNEPAPPRGISDSAAAAQGQNMLMGLYDNMIRRIRTHRPNVPVVIGSFYGGHLLDTGQATWQNPLTKLANGDYATGNETRGPIPHLVFTAHNYYSGVGDTSGPDYDGDGRPDNDGLGRKGFLRQGNWGESYNTASCYGKTTQANPAQSWTGSCQVSNDHDSVSGPTRGGNGDGRDALAGQRNNAANHDRIAQQAEMPFFMGEWSLARYRQGKNYGWWGAPQALCDRLYAYDTVPWVNPRNQTKASKISWAYWAWDSRTDGGYGLWNSKNNRWAGDPNVASTVGDLSSQFIKSACRAP